MCGNPNKKEEKEISEISTIITDSEPIFEIYASSEYINKPPQSQNFIFILDISNNSIQSGCVKLTIDCLRYFFSNSNNFCGERTYFSFITYNKNFVNF